MKVKSCDSAGFEAEFLANVTEICCVPSSGFGPCSEWGDESTREKADVGERFDWNPLDSDLFRVELGRVHRVVVYEFTPTS